MDKEHSTLKRGYAISVDRAGGVTRIHASRGDTVYTASFTPGRDNKPRDDAINSLMETICGFGKSQILVALYYLERRTIMGIKPLKSLAHRKKAKPVQRDNGAHIENHDYNAGTKNLTVTFRGGRKYRYSNVGPEIAQGLADASSKGSFMHSSVIGKFDATKI